MKPGAQLTIDEMQRRSSTAQRLELQKYVCKNNFQNLHNISVKLLCRRDKRQWTNAIAEEAEKAAATGNMKVLYDCSSRITEGPAKTPIKDKQVALINDPQEQLKRWHEHFQDVVKQLETEKPLPAAIPPRRTQKTSHVSSTNPSVAEIERAIRSMNTGKSCGVDNICHA